MPKKECVAMLLAGGKGSRLKGLTEKLAKPAVRFGGKYRIIDFCLSNCLNSGIHTVGVLTQYQPLVLNSYIGIGSAWDLDRKDGGVSVLPPFMHQHGGDWYQGTAHAIYSNIDYIDLYDPQYVLILSGDHVYKMDYSAMIAFHKQKSATASIAVIKVPWDECSRFGIMNTTDEMRIVEFEEKPDYPKNNLASMGVYLFDWPVLKKFLLADQKRTDTSQDFGKDIIPHMLQEGEAMYAYPFQGYWKDVGTVESLWQANMDLLEDEPELKLFDRDWRIYSVNPNQPPQYIAPSATLKRCLINEGCLVYGEVDHSVLFPGVTVGEGSRVVDSVIMNDVKIGRNAVVERAIIDTGTIIDDHCHIRPQEGDEEEIILITENSLVQSTKSPSRHETILEGDYS